MTQKQEKVNKLAHPLYTRERPVAAFAQKPFVESSTFNNVRSAPPFTVQGAQLSGDEMAAQLVNICVTNVCNNREAALV